MDVVALHARASAATGRIVEGVKDDSGTTPPRARTGTCGPC
ncbi:MAG: hypothetical protein QOK43_2491 [Acidimicrobiaceae bacterium]|nr:hypothetical protein [Acidimicrobiaceae bacterium]